MVERKKDDVIEAADDVAVLYSWANLHGAKYRDFSASRQELRAQSRHRTEQDALAQEAVAAVAEENAKPAVEAQAPAAPETATMAANARKNLRPEMRPLGEPKSAHQKTTVQYERMPAPVAALLATAATDSSVDAPAPKIAPPTAPEMAPIANGTAAPADRAPAERPERYANLPREKEYREQPPAEAQYREQPRREFRETPNWERDRSEPQGREPQSREPYREPLAREPQYREAAPREPQYREPQSRESQVRDPYIRESQSRGAQNWEPQLRETREPQYRDVRETQSREAQYRETREPQYREPQYPEAQYREQPNSNPGTPFGEQAFAPRVERRSPNARPEFTPTVERRVQREQAFSYQSRPSWMASESEAALYGANGDGSETLQQSRERVASRWFALKGVFDNSANEPRTERRRNIQVPTIAVFSLAGGVGKTSLVATLGRSLSALGERVLLADTSSYGLLPYYFGARDLRPGVMRTFSPPGGGTDAPVNLLNLDADSHETDPQNMDWLAEDLNRNARGCSRILVDLATASASLTRRALRMTPTVLVPIIPDMNSIVTLSVVDGFFRNHQNSEGRPVQPYYVLNQFDPSMPLHLDVREVLRQQLGERLLPFVLRRSQAVSEALAEGMTVVDYAPDSTVADDYQQLADWLRSVSAPAGVGYRGMRWSER